jgi:hypothetical protein
MQQARFRSRTVKHRDKRNKICCSISGSTGPAQSGRSALGVRLIIA